MSNSSSLNEFSEHLKQYVRTTIEIIKLELIERTIIICSYILIQILKWLLFAVGVFMFSIAIAIYISDKTSSFAMGFGVVGLFYLILAIIFSIISQKNVEQAIQNKIIKHIFSDEHQIKL
jgi:ABC-type transport system involved in multi-copper enzyme maturation permease subunit